MSAFRINFTIVHSQLTVILRHDNSPRSIPATEQTDRLSARGQFPLLPLVRPPVLLVPPQLRQYVVHERRLFLQGVVPPRAVRLQLGRQVLEEFNGCLVLEDWLPDGSHPAVDELDDAALAGKDELAVLVCRVYPISVVG